MSKSWFIKYPFVVFLFVVFFFPLFSQASSFISTGLPCNVDIIPDDSNRSTLVYCPICRDEGTTKLKLKWEINDRSFTKPFCQVSCSKSDGKSCGLWHSKNKEGILSSVNTDTRLKPTDTVYLSNDQLPRTSTYKYRVVCLSTDGCPSGGCFSTSALITVSPDCRVPCEVPFETIATELDGEEWSLSRFFRITITEKDLASWANDKTDQDSPLNIGSGNQDEIISYLIQTQNGSYSPKSSLVKNKETGPTCPVGRSVYFNSEIRYLDHLDSIFFSQKLKSYVNDYGYPIQLKVRNKDWEVFAYDESESLGEVAHAVIVIFMEDLTEDNMEPYFNLKILDPNVPEEIISLKNCKPAYLYISSSGYETHEFGGFGCTPDNDWYGETFYGEEIFVYSNTSSWGSEPSLTWIDKYHEFKTSLCYSGSAQFYTDFCQRGRLTDWLKNNLTKLQNPSDGGGNCYAWTMFMLKVAYFGDFVGTDYHPNDGKYVGVDCDANHYPITKKTSFLPATPWALLRSGEGKEGWMANILGPLENFKFR